MEELSEEDQLLEIVGEFALDPEGYVLHCAYEWGTGPLSHTKGPRKWQREELAALSKHLQNPKTRFDVYRLAVSSGHGIGKSAFIGMIINWALSTCEDCKVVVTANTLTQMRTKTWPEVTHWHTKAITADWFKPVATSLHSTQKDHETTWGANAIAWSENNTEAFAGLHNQNKRIVVIYDEASGISDKVWDTTEGALTDENTEIIWIVFGNPTRNTGKFRECFRQNKHRWRNRQIDSRNVEGTNKKQIAEWEKDHGENSDFFKVRVRGVFPAQSVKQFISEVDADAGYGRNLKPEQYNFAPKIIAVEPAWEGDDELVIGMRQGLKFEVLSRMPKNDNDFQVGQLVAEFEDTHQADAVFIDLGYGTGIYSYGKTLNRSWVLVAFGEAAGDPDPSVAEGFLNKRSEMWSKSKQWLKEGGAYPPIEQMRQEAMGPETVSRVDGKVQLESKNDMKKRGIPSPNLWDCLALTFAHPVQKKIRANTSTFSGHQGDWKPLKRGAR